jgi:hypothetical protein
MRTVLWLALAACLVTGGGWQVVYAQPLSACEKGEFSEDGACEDPDYTIPPPQAMSPQGAFPQAVCRAGYFQQGPRLCMTAQRGPNTFGNALVDCQDILGRVADFGDWRYRVFRGDGVLVVDSWLGPLTGDDRALFINSSNAGNFDGEGSRFDNRSYACAHDDDG